MDSNGTQCLINSMTEKSYIAHNHLFKAAKELACFRYMYIL